MGFIKDLETGKVGEELVIKKLESLESMVKVVDVSDDSDYWKEGYDLIAYFETRPGIIKQIKIEVKTTMTSYNSYFIETTSNPKLNKAGWACTTKSDIIFFVQTQHNEVHALITKNLQDSLLSMLNSCRPMRCHSSGAEGLILDFNLAQELGILNKVYSMEKFKIGSDENE